MDYSCVDLPRSSVLAGLLLLALPACAPKDSDSSGCGGVSCDPCYVLDEEECSCCGGNETGTGGWCSPMHGARLDREQVCVHDYEFAVCGNPVCTDIPVAYQDPDGTCWHFGSDCLEEGNDAPPGWTYDTNGDLCPELADSENLPPPC